MRELSEPQRLICFIPDCSVSNFFLSNNDYLGNLSVSSVKDHSCLHSPPASSTIYMSASFAIYPDAFATALMIIQFSFNLKTRSYTDIVVLGWLHILLISALLNKHKEAVGENSDAELM